MMTRITYLILLVWCFITSLHAQTQSFALPPSLKQQIVQKLAPLDKTQVPGGFLLNQTVSFVQPTLFLGRIEDTSVMQANQFALLYNQFRSCYVGTGQNLPLPASALLPNITETSDDTVKIAHLALRYGLIRNDAITANLIQEVNGQYRDVVGRTESPYVSPFCITATTMTEKVTTLQPIFTLPQNLAFMNIGLTGATWQIDASDGQGFQSISATSSYTAQYADGGRKQVTLKMTYQQLDYFMYTTIEVVDSSNSLKLTVGGGSTQYNLTEPDETIFLTSTKSFQGPDETSASRNSVELNIFYACDDHKLRKPIIFVGGYENKRLSENLDNDWKSGLMKRIRKDFSATIPVVTLIDGKSNMEETLKASGYDLIYVDWANGAFPGVPLQQLPGIPNGDDYIQRNAYAIETALTWINDQKKQSGSEHQNILIGGSMGGLVCKYALLDMKNNGPSHDCHTFITYDSPLNGANVPLGSQAAFRYFEYIAHDVLELPVIGGVGSILPEKAAAAFGSPDRPAFRQMVIQRFWKSGNGYVMGRSPEYTALMAEIAAMGTLDMEHIAVTNGSNPNVMLENETVAGGFLTNFDLI
jgi:hypothetical protein